jgi:hypothetical protein
MMAFMRAASGYISVSVQFRSKVVTYKHGSPYG